MSRSGKVQKKKERKKKLKSFCLFFVLSLTGLFFLTNTLYWTIVLLDWDDNGIQEYRGEYSLEVRKQRRGTTCIFTLGNGDITIVPYNALQNRNNLLNNPEEETNEVLLFRYSKHRNPIALGKHAVISISSESGVVYVNDNHIKRSAQENVVVGVAFIVIILSPLLIVGVIRVFNKTV